MPLPDVAPPSTLPAGERVWRVARGVLALAAAFVAYQIGSGVALVVLLLAQGVAPSALLGVLGAGLGDYPYTTLVANAAGQGVGLALVAVAFARLSTPRVRRFLRLGAPDARLLGASILGVLLLVPVVQAVGEWNRLLPVPDWLVEMEAQQMALIAAVLGRADAWLFNLVLLAAVPAVCEELLFRGFFQRFVEKAVGVGGAIALSGVLFALYHLRPTQILPLALVGLYLAYVVWRTDSLLTGMAVHFVHNGLVVIVAVFVEGVADPDAAFALPIPLVVACGVAFGALMFWLHPRRGAGRRAGGEGAGAYPPPSPERSEHDR